MSQRRHSLLRSLEIATHAVDRRLERDLRADRVSRLEGHLLMVVAEHGRMPLAHVRSMLERQGSTMTGLVDRLEERGLLERSPAVGDRRAWDLAVTPNGRRIADGLQHRIAELEDRLASRLREDQLDAADIVLRTIAEAAADDG